MSDDFERQVSESLGRAAEGAPGATGLAEGARSRLRRRRRTTVAALAAALVVVSVPVGIRLTSGGGGDGATVAVDPAGDPAAPEWRTESWRDATVQVPADWGYGSLSSWCAAPDGEQPVPVVQRPTTIAPTIACLNPFHGYGVQFVDARSIMLTSDEAVPTLVTDVDGGGESDYPAGAWSGYKVVGGTMVQVVATDEESAMAIYGSIAVLEGPDANGCPALLGEAEAGDGGAGDAVSLCRYSDVDELASSRVLSDDDGAALVAAIEEAPDSEVAVDCPAGPRTVLLQGGEYLGAVDDCRGVLVGGRARQVTDVIRELARMP